MNAQGKRVSTWMGIFVFALAILSGCTAKYATLTTAGNVNVEILPSRDECVEIKDVSVYRDGDRLLVTGKAMKRGPLFATYKGHIDVAFVSPDEGLKMGEAEYKHLPSRNIISSFEVSFPIPAEPGARVLLVFHPVNGADSDHLAAIDRLIAKAAS